MCGYTSLNFAIQLTLWHLLCNPCSPLREGISFSNNCGNHRQIYGTTYSNSTYGIISNYDNENFNCEWLIVAGELSPLRYINLRLIANNLDCHSDTLYVFDGPSYEHKLLASLNGQSAPPRPLIASSGYMLLLQYWHESEVASPFTAEFSITECPLNCSNHGSCANNRCDCDPFWTGAACQIESCPNNCTLMGQCAILTHVEDTREETTTTDYQCKCKPNFIGQSCDVLNNLSGDDKPWFNWRILFDHEKLFSSRASHASVYDPLNDSIYTYGGREFETVFGDLLVYDVKYNRWHNLTHLRPSHAMPQPVWGHTLNIVDYHLILFGGILSNGTLSNELWFYDILKREWLLPNVKLSSIPGLAFHTATIVESKWLYIFGGRLQNGTYSSNFYRLELDGAIQTKNEEQWQLVYPINEKSSTRQMAGHAAVYYKHLKSIVIFGGASLINERLSRLSNDIHLFNVDNRFFTTLHVDLDTDIPIPNERAFHSMLLLGHYLVIFGGHTHHPTNSTPQANCQDSRLYIYSLSCHRWIDFDFFMSTLSSAISSSHFPLEGLVSHSFVARKNLLFVLGGYSGLMHNEVFVYRVPQTLFNASEYEFCFQLRGKSACNMAPFCFWCPSAQNRSLAGYCSYYELKCTSQMKQLGFCPGLCSRLNNCYSCLAFNTIVSSDHSDETTDSNYCMWNSLDHRCFRSNISDSAHFDHFLINNLECKKHNIETGIALLKYYYPQNLSNPDEVIILKRTDVRAFFQDGLSKNLLSNETGYSGLNKPQNSTYVNTARILGYIHPFGLQPYNENVLRIYLGSTSPLISFSMDGLTKAYHNLTSKTYHRSYVDLPINFSSSTLLEDNYLIDFIVKFPIRTASKAFEYEKIELSASNNNGSSTIPLTITNLTPYRSAQKCHELVTCGSCLSNIACGWCASSSECITRYDNCASISNQQLLIVDPQHCPLCTDLNECQKCVQSPLECEWLFREGVCVRRGRFENAIRELQSCPSTCNARSSCEWCLDDSHNCVWCASSQQCISSSMYQSSPVFHHCQSFGIHLISLNSVFLSKHLLVPYKLNHSQILCSKCLRFQICSACEHDFSCEWCYLPSEPSYGFCALKNHSNRCNIALDSGLPIDFQSDKELSRQISQYIPSNATCPLVNECELDIDNCHTDSICIDTAESFKCLCRPGFVSDGMSCVRTCDQECVRGYCSEYPDFKCICDLGWTGADCSIDCACHNHSTCEKGEGVCDHCEDNTRGKYCHLCSAGSFGNATNSVGCQVCDCNGHGDESQGYCHPVSGVCYCTHNTEGTHCERCVAGTYGNARNHGHCFMECQHRAFVSTQSGGFFGSYIRDLHFAKHSHSFIVKEHHLASTVGQQRLDCLWIFTSHTSPKTFSTFSNYYSKQLQSNSSWPIGITIFQSYHLNCSMSRVLIYDGIPRFISASNDTKATTLASLCGAQAFTDTSVVAESGFATVLFSSDNLNQGFNASYVILSPPNTSLIPFRGEFSSEINSNYTHSNTTNSTFFKIETLWTKKQSGSLWLKMWQTVESMDNLLILIGEHEHRVNLTLSFFNVSSKSWLNIDKNSTVFPSNRLWHASTHFSNTIFIYGGLSMASNQVLESLWSCSMYTHPTSLSYSWNRIVPNNESSSPPPLIGHSLSVISRNSHSALILVGGYSPTHGYLNKQYLFMVHSNEWQVLVTKGTSPIGIFGHSAIYHHNLHSLYLFGGMQFQESQKFTISNTLYTLNLTSMVWHRYSPSASFNQDNPLPLYMHRAVSTQEYMIVLGGRTTFSEDMTEKTPDTYNSIFAYRYHCGSWTSLKELSQQIKSNLNSASLISNWLYIFEAEQQKGSTVAKNTSIKAIHLPIDLCELYSNNQQRCQSTVGCSFCALHDGNHHESLCFDTNSQLPDWCTEEHLNENLNQTLFIHHGSECGIQNERRGCARYSNCYDCTAQNFATNQDEHNCQWCTACRKEGQCIALNDTCDAFDDLTSFRGDFCANFSIVDASKCPQQRCLATDCDKCSKKSLVVASHDRLTCVWTRQVYKFVRLGPNYTNVSAPIFDWVCIDSAIIEASLQLPNVKTVPPLACPARCHRHRTCSLCLEGATGDESGSHECVWSEVHQECMSPTYSVIRCEGGLCGGLVHRRSYSQCPATCESHTKASDCLTANHCGWCAIDGFEVDGVGICLQGGLFGTSEEICTNGNINLLQLLKSRSFYKPITNFTVEWHYLYLPKENECLNHHHTCDPISQECIDLQDGFMCRCKQGYKLVESTCKPICHQGCVFGICDEPNVCKCGFGYIGHDCSLECKCNGHSTCPAADLHECVECVNNTQGRYCDQCKPFFVGDPRNGGTCQSCLDYCNHHSSMCFSEEMLNSSLNSNSTLDQTFWNELASKVTEGPKLDVMCIECANNTEGERCDRCRLGYFKISEDIRDGCRKCMCNEHGSICNPFNGENCNCQNNTENDRQCNYLNTKEYSNYINKTYFFKSAQIMTTYSLPCWMLQCSKCKDYFNGIPTNGHQCYRQMQMDKEYCLDPVSQDDCMRKPRPLQQGRTIFFSIQPRYMNVDIKLTLHMLGGDVDMYMFSKDDLFVIRLNQSTGEHHTFLDHDYIQHQFLNISQKESRKSLENSTFNEEDLWWLAVDDGSVLNYGHTLRIPIYINEQHMGGDLPHYYTVTNIYEIAIFRNVRHRLEVIIPHRMHDLRTTRFYFMLRGNNLQGLTNKGFVLFRQDQCRIDLFIFFSVFFSSFFLFLCMTVLAWKLRQFLDNRRAQHMHEIELEHMASRPFAQLHILFDSETGLETEAAGGFRKVHQSTSVQSTPAKKMSLFRQIALGFKESTKIYPENIHSPKKSPEKVSEIGIKPVSIEPTWDGHAAVLTTLIQLPGGHLVPNRLTAASALVSLKQSPHLVQQLAVGKEHSTAARN